MSTHTDIRTNPDQKFERAKHMYGVAERFAGAIVVLQELCCAINDRTSSCHKLLEKSAFVKKIVIPLISDSIVNITTAANVLSPITGIKYVHQRKECKRKQEILTTTTSSTLSPGEELIIQHMKDIQHINQNDYGTPVPKWQRKSHACVSPTDISDNNKLLTPESGKGYSKNKIVNMMLNVPSGNHKLRHATIRAIADHQKKHNTPCCSRTIYRLLEKHAKGAINILGEWKG
jgi:hypothetical protein